MHICVYMYVYVCNVFACFTLTSLNNPLQSLEWRVKFSADTVVTHWKAPDVLKKYFAGGVSGFDKEGCPVYILPAAKIQISG